MTQAPAPIFKIPTESPQPARGRASRALKLAVAPPRAARRVAGTETRAATRGDGEVIDWHAYAVVRQYGESGVTALLEPGTIKGLVYASSMVILHVARHRLPVPRLARWMLALGITASLAVNVAQGWSHGLVGAAAAAWPAVALVGSYELLAWMIRTTGGESDHLPSPDDGVPQPDQPGPSRRPAVPPACETVTAAAPGDGASLEPGSAHEPSYAAAQVHGPGPAGPHGTDQANQAGAPVRESTRPLGPDGPTDPGRARRTAPAGDINAAAVAAYRTSLQEGTPLSERKLQRHTARPHGGGRAPGWPRPGRDRTRVDRAGTDRCTGQTAPAFEQCVTRQSLKCLPTPAAGVACWHASVRWSRWRWNARRVCCSQYMVAPVRVTDGGDLTKARRTRSA
jgi:hypothetical protein